MATNKDIKELMEARKARRAIPQTDPAEVVDGPSEPETPAPAPAESPVQPSEAADRIANSGDPRMEPVPPDDPFTPMTLRVRNHHHRQIKAESYYKDLPMQEIVETALDEYFRRRYGSRG